MFGVMIIFTLLLVGTMLTLWGQKLCDDEELERFKQIREFTVSFYYFEDK